jgi:hypothetical protein
MGAFLSSGIRTTLDMRGSRNIWRQNNKNRFSSPDGGRPVVCPTSSHPLGVRSFFAKRTTSKPAKEPEVAALNNEICRMDVTQVAAESDSLPFLDVCQVFERVEGTSKRLEIIEILRVFFKGLMSAAKPGDVAMAVHLMLSRMGPEYEAVELGVGEASLVKAIAQSTGKQPAVIKQDFERLGDLGLVAMNARTVQTMLVKPKPLTIRSLFRSLQDIAALTGLSVCVLFIPTLFHCRW